MRRASARASVPLTPAAALRLWSDVDRWQSFVEGYARQLELTDTWPDVGGRVVWESGPVGRGRVTETVTENREDRFATQVYEKALIGTQTLRAVGAAGGCEVELSLEYELEQWGPIRGLADMLFIRRALRDSLRRTLFRFGVEAEEEARYS